MTNIFGPICGKDVHKYPAPVGDLGGPVGNPGDGEKYPRNFSKSYCAPFGQGIQMTYALLRESGKKSKFEPMASDASQRQQASDVAGG